MVTDPTGAQVNGFGLVAADTEETGQAEYEEFTSTAVLNRMDDDPSDYSVCGYELAGLGTDHVVCGGDNGAAGDIGYGDLELQTIDPTSLSASAYEASTNPGKEGFAFAVVTSTVTLDKQVDGRANPTDSFDVDVTAPDGAVLGSATTGTANSASTGRVAVLPASPGAEYTLSEAATAGTGTNLADYAQSWSCSNTNTGSTTVLPTGGGTSVQVAPQPADDITCTLTNTASTVGTPMANPEVAGITFGGLLVIGLGLFGLRRHRMRAV